MLMLLTSKALMRFTPWHYLKCCVTSNLGNCRCIQLDEQLNILFSEAIFNELLNASRCDGMY